MTAPAREPMRTAPARPTALLVGTAVLMAAAGLQNSLLALRAVDEGFPTITVSLLAAAYFAGFIVGALHITSWVRRTGHVRAFAALASIASVLVLLHSLVVHPVPWVLGRFGSGICLSGLIVIVESWLSTSATPATRGRVLASYMVVVLLAMAGAQLALVTAPIGDFTLFAVVSAGFSLALVPLLLSSGPEPVVTEAPRMTVRDLAHRSPVGAVTAVAGGATWGIGVGLGAVYAQSRGMSELSVTAFSGLLLAGGLLTQFPVGHAADRRDRRSVIAAVATAAAVVALGLALLPDDVPDAAVALGGLALGAGVLPLYSLAIAVSIDQVEEHQVMAASSAVMLLSGMGSAVGPLVAGVVEPVAGPNALPEVIGVICAFTALHAASLSVARGTHRPVRRLAAPVLPRTSAALARMWVPKPRRTPPPL